MATITDLIKELKQLLDSLPDNTVYNIYSTVTVRDVNIISVIFRQKEKMYLVDFRYIKGVFYYVDAFISHKLSTDLYNSKQEFNKYLLSKLR